MYNLLYESSYPTPYASSPFLYLLLLSMSGQKHTPDTTVFIKDAYDYIVVGAGSGGSVVASRLAEKECVSVLLLEAGKSPPKLTDLPVLSASFVNTDLDWRFKIAPQTHAGEVVNMSTLTIMSAGKTVGGSSTINGMQNLRGNKKDYENWVQQGATGWSYDDVFSYFIKSEDNTDYGRNGCHGIGGPVTMSKPPYNSEFKSAIYEYAATTGYSILDSNCPKQNGFNDFQATMRQGQRCGTAKAYLVPNERRPNLDIVANAYVTKVLINSGKAEGVVFDFQGQTLEVKARRELILSAGTIKSPHILMLSGIGPEEELKKHNIPVVANLPVGRNLQEHWAVISHFKLGDQIRPFSEKEQDPFNIWRYIQTKTGPLASLTATTNMAFLHKDGLEGPDDYPDYQLYWGEGIHPQMRNVFTFISQFGVMKSNEKPFYWCFAQLLHPKARGVVSLNSSDPYDPPLVDPKYFSQSEDLETIVAGIKKCFEIAASDPLRQIGSEPISTLHPECQSAAGEEDYFQCIAKSTALTCSHQVGTVRMGGKDDPMAVLDPQLRVKGIKGLRVVDASVMPSITSGNTQTPTIMIAEKASDMIKESIQCPPTYPLWF